VIVVIGSPSLRTGLETPSADGLASRIARRAAATGASVQLVGKVGDDPAGDALLIDLSHAGIGHAALLRDPTNPTPLLGSDPPSGGDDGLASDVDDLLAIAERLEIGESAPVAEEGSDPLPGGARPSLEAADIELALRYLGDFRVVVVAEPLDDGSAAALADGATYAAAQVVVLVAAGTLTPPSLAAATILEVPSEDPDGAFAGLVAAYAAAIDRGVAPADAFSLAAADGGWEPTPA
jgi:hypothetical protein